MKKWILILLPTLIFAQDRPSQTWEKIGMLSFSLTGSCLEAQKEAEPKMEYYHEVKYASTMCYVSTGICFGLSFNKDRNFKRSFLRGVGLILINWVIWELKYSAIVGDDRTYNAWPFKRHWLDYDNIIYWNIGRMILGLYLFIRN